MKILIIDDSLFSQMSMTKFLKVALKPGETLVTAVAKDGLEGLEKFREFRPDCVLVDLLMPRLDGRQFVQAVGEQERAKIIIVSADVQQSIRAEMEGYHVRAFVNKPMDGHKAQEILDYVRNNQHG